MWGWWALASIAAVVFLIRKQQWRLLYLPNFNPVKGPMFTPAKMGLENWKQVEMPVDSATFALAYFLKYPARGRCINGESAYKNKPTLIYFHGNAGNIGLRVPLVADWQDRLRCNILLVAYRGYDGSSKVTPSEAGMQQDGVAALKYLEKEGVDTSKVFILGTSLGGAVTFATALASPYPLKGIAVENTFTSIKDMTHVLLGEFVRQGSVFLRRERQQTESRGWQLFYGGGLHVLSALPTVWGALRPVLLELGWESIHRVRQLPEDMNILFLSGARDELIPVRHMSELYDACTARKKFVSFPHGTHNDTCMDPRWIEEVKRWMEACLAGEKY